MTNFHKKRFHTFRKEERKIPCTHGWDGRKFWLTPKGMCVTCGVKIVKCCPRDTNDDGDCYMHRYTPAKTAETARQLDDAENARIFSSSDWNT